VADSAWLPREPFEGLATAGRHGRPNGPPGLVVEPLSSRSAAMLIGRFDQPGQVDSALTLLMGAPPPRRPGLLARDGRQLLWSGPDQWLFLSEAALDAEALGQLLGSSISVVAQGDGRGFLRLSGPRVREVLAKGCPIDLDPRVFAPGAVAVTAAAHIGVTLWRTEDGGAFELAVARSLAGSFWSWLAASAAPVGFEVCAPA
jgi:methylglutamate dehydrogenase subunit D